MVAQFSRLLQGYFKTLWAGIENIKLFILAVEHSILVVIAANHSGGYQFNTRGKPTYDSHITKFVFRSIWDIKFCYPS